MKISKIGEFGLIHSIKKMIGKDSALHIGIGDDCAVVPSPKSGEEILLTVDNVVEGIHFNESLKPFWIGRKAMARSVSDIAAMGGIAKYALISLGVNGSYEFSFIREIYRGLIDAAKTFGIAIAGGDITNHPDRLFISVALTGFVPRNGAVLRRGAQTGDSIYVTGSFGGSILGKHYRFKPRIREGLWLREKKIPSAMIDVSDGLLSDLGHILEESKIGARIDRQKVPVSGAAKKLGGRDPKSAMQHALTDGEDYELIFTSRVSEENWFREFKHIFKVPVTCIGRCTPINGRMEWMDGKEVPIETKGFTHF